MGRQEVRPSDSEYGTASEAYALYTGRSIFQRPASPGWGRRGHYSPREYYNPGWDLGSRNETLDRDDLVAMGFVSEDAHDAWADDWEPYMALTRRPVQAEWSRDAEVQDPRLLVAEWEDEKPKPQRRRLFPPLMPRAKYGEGPAHGTNSRYSHKGYKCRCEPCSTAHREYMRGYNRVG
jgi:hypothetical protein